MTKGNEDVRDNRILAQLTADELGVIQGFLSPVRLEFKATLHEQLRPIEAVYFLTSGMVSLVTEFEEGGIIETGTIGREGMVGVTGFLGNATAAGRAIVQLPGTAYRLSLADMQSSIGSNSRLMQLAIRYATIQLATVAQTAACNRAHTVEARLAKWLLITSDRVDAEQFPLTQEFLGQMLGVRRSSVSIASAALQRAGLLQYTRGQMAISNRAGLEETSCECYAIIRDHYDSSLVPSASTDVEDGAA